MLKTAEFAPIPKAKMKTDRGGEKRIFSQAAESAQ